MAISEFPDIPISCPDNCRPEVDEAVFLILSAAINGWETVDLKVILERTGLSELAWGKIRNQVAAHFPDHILTCEQSGKRGPRPLQLVPKRR